MADPTFSFLDGSTFNQAGVAQNNIAQNSVASLSGNQSANTYSSYIPPSTSQSVPSSLITGPGMTPGGGGLQMPTATPNPDPTGAGLVTATIVGNPPTPTPVPQQNNTTNIDSTIAQTGSATAGQTENPTADQNYQSIFDAQGKGLQQLQTDQKAALGQGAALTAAENAQGVPDAIQKIKTIDQQLAERTAAFNNAAAGVETHGLQNGVPGVFYQGEQAAIRRQQAVEIGGLSAIKAALQGNYELAESRAKAVVSAQFADAEQKIKNDESFLRLNQAHLSNAERLAASKIKQNITVEKAQLSNQKENVKTALTSGVETQFYTKPNGTVVRTNDGFEFHNPQEAFKAGVLQDFSNAPKVNPVGKSETKILNGHSVHIVYDKAGNVLQKTDLGVAGKGKSGPTDTSVPNTKQTVLAGNKMDGFFTSKRGADGFVSPQSYQAAREAWANDKHPLTKFDSQFSKYINPADAQDYQGSKVKVTKPKATNGNVTVNK